jgi:hypothetical protein
VEPDAHLSTPPSLGLQSRLSVVVNAPKTPYYHTHDSRFVRESTSSFINESQFLSFAFDASHIVKNTRIIIITSSFFSCSRSVPIHSSRRAQTNDDDEAVLSVNGRAA